MITKWLHASMLLIVLPALLVGSERCKAGTHPDSLLYFGHSFVELKTSEGKVVYIDPYAFNEFADSADVVLITHEHSDHNDLSRVREKSTCQVIRSANAQLAGVYQTMTIGNIKVTAVPAYNSYHVKSQCVGYVVEFDGIKIYHAGDTGKITEMADLAGQHITYALLPMDVTYTMSPEAATDAAAMIQATYDMPIHTMAPPDSYSDAIVARFTSPHKLVVKPFTSIELNNGVTGVGGVAAHAQTFALNQNYPNPFNPETIIHYQLPVENHVTLRVYDLLGKEVATLVNDRRSAGSYSVKFDASGLASGIYLYQLKAGSFVQSLKMLLLR